MPDIPLLNPTVLNGVIERFMAPETLLGRTQLMGSDRVMPTLEATVAYDVITANRTRAVPNVPNSEAHVIKQLGVGQVAASLIYLRDKKVFSPTTIRWLRTPGQLAARNAEAAVLRELRDLDNRFEKFAEFCIWQVFTTGTLQFTGGGVIIDINYQFNPTHLPTVSVSWGDPTADIIGDLKNWKRLISRDGQAVATDVYLNSVAMASIFKLNANYQDLISTQVRDEYLRTGQIANLLSLNWHEYDLAYVDDNGVVTQYIPDNKIVLLSNDNPDRWYFLEGPSADFAAPDNHIGKFSKTWEDDDPSARQFLLEWHFLPVVWRPEQIVSATIVAP
jgi:hypothetical protein